MMRSIPKATAAVIMRRAKGSRKMAKKTATVSISASWLAAPQPAQCQHPNEQRTVTAWGATKMECPDCGTAVITEE